MSGVLIAFATVMLAASSPGVTASGASTGTETTAPADAKKRICRTTQVTGSRLSKRKTCYTQAQWREIDRQTEAVTREMTDSVVGSPTDPQ